MAGSIDGILFDNDALSLLGGAQLIDQVLAVIGVDVSQSFRLDTLTYMLRRGQIGKDWQDSTRDLARQGAERIQVLRSEPGQHLLDRFVSVGGIDPGEAFLYATLIENSTVALVSGDKRSMAALCGAPELQDIEDAIAGRVICVEQLLNELVLDHGAHVIGQAFAPVRAHKTLSIVFTEHHMANEAQCLHAINSYIRDLRNKVGEEFLFKIVRGTPPLTCPACGLPPDNEDRGDEESPNYCSACNMVICPFCRSTDDCEHLVAFNWGDDHFGHTSLDAHIRLSEDVEMLGFEEAWAVVDHLVDTCPEPITTVEFFNPGGYFCRWHFAPNGTALRASFDQRVREMKADAQRRQAEEDEAWSSSE